MDRMECWTATGSRQGGGEQQPVPDPAGALRAQLGEQGAAPDPGSACHRLADPVRPSGVGGRDLRRCRPVQRDGLFGQRMERTWPDRRLGPLSARLLRQTRPAQTPLLPPAVQKRPPQSPGRTSQASVGGGRTKGLPTLHTDGEGNPFDGPTLQGGARLSRALRVLSALVDVNDPFFSHPLRCSARAKGHRQVCPRLEPSPTPGPWNPAQPPRQVSRTDTADLLPDAPTRRRCEGGGSHFGHPGANAWPGAQGAIDRTGWQGTQARQRRLDFERGYRPEPALLGQCTGGPKDQRDSGGARVI